MSRESLASLALAGPRGWGGAGTTNLSPLRRFPASKGKRVPREGCHANDRRAIGRDALADAVVKRRARHGTKDSPPHVLCVHPEIAAAIVEAEHADVAVAYPGACGSRIGRPRRKRGVCVTDTSDEVDGIEHHFGEQPQRRKVGAGTVVVIDI